MTEEVKDSPEPTDVSEKSDSTPRETESELLAKIAKLEGKLEEKDSQHKNAEKKIGEQGEELGKLRKEKEKVEPQTKEADEPKEAKKSLEDEIPEEIKKQIREKFASLPVEQRKEVFEKMDEGDWKAIYKEYGKKLEEAGFVPNFLKSLLTADKKPEEEKDNEIRQRVREILNLVVAEKNETPPGGGSAPQGVPKQAPDKKRPSGDRLSLISSKP